MSATGQSSAEEFYSRRVGDAQVLLEAARAHAGEGDVVGAIATALGSDMATLQALLWERINMAPRAPLRQLFQAAEALTATMTGFEDEPTPAWSSAADVIIAARRRMTEALDETLIAEAERGWPDVVFLAAFASPTLSDLDASRAKRTDGLPVGEFVVLRRAAAARVMLEAQASRVRGATSDAITAAYESDFLALEAYLAESAWVLGDEWLLTAIARWDLVSRAVGAMRGLPDGFLDAVTLVRHTMSEALGDADGDRLTNFFEPA